MGIFSALGKLKKNLSPRLAKSEVNKIARDKFRKEVAKERSVNWKRVRITNWLTKEYIIK